VPGGDLLRFRPADLGDVLAAVAPPVIDQERGVLPPRLPGDRLPDTRKVPDIGIVVIAAGPLPDHRHWPAIIRPAAGNVSTPSQDAVATE